MFFDRFFRPKWQHKNANVRRQALQALPVESPESQHIFAQVIAADTDPVVRQTVVRALFDTTLLERVAQQDSDATVREHAVQRLGSLLSGIVVGAPAAELRREAAARIEDRRILEFVARNAVDPTLRWFAAERIDREALFADIAIADPDPQLRLDAVARVTQKSTLERILKQVRTKDKRVRAQVQERLDALQAEVEKPEQLAKAARHLCAQLDGLLPLFRSREAWRPILESAQRLANEWAQIKAQWPNDPASWPAELEERFVTLWNTLTEEAAARAAQSEQIQREQEQAQARKQQTVDELAAAQQFMGEFANGRTQEADPVSRLVTIEAGLRQRLTELGTESDADPNPLRGQLQEALDAATRLLAEHKQMADVLKRQEAWRHRAQTLLDQEHYVSKEDLRKLEKSLGSAARYYIAVLRDGVLTNEALLAQLRQRQEKDEAARKDSVRLFKASVNELTAALSDGRVAEATALQKQLQNMAEWLAPGDVANLKRAGAMQEFQRATAQLRELKDWQGWGSLHGREELCTRARGLLAEVQAHAEDAQFDWDEAAKRIRELRQSWKEMGPNEPREGKELWNTFNEVCNQAYERCQHHFAVRADTRADNLAKREALVQQMRAYLQDHVAERPYDVIDYKALDRTIHQSEQAWRALGPVDRSKFRTVRDDYTDVLTKLREAVNQERERNGGHKEALIKRAEKLGKTLSETGQPDSEQIQRAVDQIKQFQEQWKQIGRATDETALWERFRAAADVIFAMRQTQLDVQNQERRTNVETRERLCAQIEAACALGGDALKRAIAEVDVIKDQWQALTALPKDRGHNTLQRRFTEAVRQFEVRLRERAEEDRHTARVRAQQRAQLCDDLEAVLDTLLVNGVSEVVEAPRLALEARWEDLATDANKSDPVVQRYRDLHTQIEKARHGDDAERARLRASREALRLENLRRKEELCLRMEILAEVDSPAEAKQARLAYQVHQLAEHMAGGGASALARGALREQQANDILLSWWTTGAAPESQQTRLSERFYAARQAFDRVQDTAGILPTVTSLS